MVHGIAAETLTEKRRCKTQAKRNGCLLSVKKTEGTRYPPDRMATYTRRNGEKNK